MLAIADVESLLGDSGQFSLVDWLLAENHLPYSEYEAWRNGEQATLEAALTWPRERLQAAVEQAEAICQKLKLEAEMQVFDGWHGEAAPLLLSRDATLQRALACSWRRAEDLPQLDLFLDNAAVITENRLRSELAARRFESARRLLGQLSAEHPGNEHLGAYGDLINYGAHVDRAGPVDGDAYPEELHGLLTEVAPLARDTLKAQSRDYLALGWRRLAVSAEGQALAQRDWRCHPGFAYSQIPDWQAVWQSLEADPLAWRQPDLLCLLANAGFLGPEPQLGYLLWGQLAERFPDYAEEQLERHPLATRHPLLTELWHGFLAFDDHWPSQWFLAYLLIQRPGLVHLLETLPTAGGEPLQNPVNRTVLNLIWAKIRGQEQKLHRAQLKTAAPALLNCFMNKRDWYAGR